MIDRAGIAAGDGATHHGIFDVAFLSHIPGMSIISPATYSALEEAVEFANMIDEPIAVRYPNSSESEEVVKAFYSKPNATPFGARANFEPDDAPEYVFITYGALASRVLKAADIVRCVTGTRVGVVLLEVLKPYDYAARTVLPYISDARRILFAEEGIKNGGAAMLMRDALEQLGVDLSSREYLISAIDDNFASPTEPCDIYDHVGLSAEKLAEKMLNGKKK